MGRYINYLEMEERLTQKRDGSVPRPHGDRALKPKMFETGEPYCPVETYCIFKIGKPKAMLKENAPFYLQIIIEEPLWRNAPV